MGASPVYWFSILLIIYYAFKWKEDHIPLVLGLMEGRECRWETIGTLQDQTAREKWTSNSPQSGGKTENQNLYGW